MFLGGGVSRKVLGPTLPIHNVAGCEAPCEVLTRLLELQADVHGGRGVIASASPLHNIAAFAFLGEAQNDVKFAQLSLENRADWQTLYNQVCQPEGIISRQHFSRAYSRFVRL